MKYQVLATLCWLLVYAGIAVLFAALDAPTYALIAVAVAALAGQQLYCKILVPRGARARP